MDDEPIRSFFGENRWLSNFWPAPVELDGVEYATVEHAYQAAKFDDPAVRAKIGAEPKPAGAKRLARQFTPRADWDQIKVAVMAALVRQKFTRHADLRARLIATDLRELQEGNAWGDTWWGVDLNTGEGFNCLGKLIMEVRNLMHRGLA